MSNTQKIEFSFDNGLEICIDRELESKKHLQVLKNENDLFKQFTKISCEVDGFSSFTFKNHFNFHATFEGTKYTGQGLNGNDALWVPLNEERGLKIVSKNEKFSVNFEDCKKTLEIISSSESELFPRIYSYEIAKDKLTGEEYFLIFMENVKNTSNSKPSFEEIKYVPHAHHVQILEMLPISPKLATSIISELAKLQLEPEDSWYKNSNFIGDKIVDFHRFKYSPERYNFKSRAHTPQQISDTYNRMVDRYLAIRDSGNLPKWKGKIYQGFKFDNGASMPGYCSNQDIKMDDETILYDSYRKLPFFPMANLKNKKVLDIGSNQGFFSFQAAASTSSSVVGIELTEQDVLAARDINEILQYKNVEFVHGDAVEYIEKTEEKYGLVILNSVLHQIFPNFLGCEEFMTKIARNTETLVFETPLNHKLMVLSPKDVAQKLKSLGFKIVRLVYIYDAYSSGYRANYICHTERYEHPEKFID
tara:strand:+ start:1821 stop:3248 length:1428 start_codon:yes stop_codon:yes gene_type:complete